jgi:hypothetical protein
MTMNEQRLFSGLAVALAVAAVTLAGSGMLAKPADAYEWYPVPIDSVEHTVYELHFGGVTAYAGADAGVFRGEMASNWNGMGLDYPGLGAHAILSIEGSGWVKHAVAETATPGATGLAIGDVDGGGYADIIVAAKEPSDQVGWYQNPLPGPVTPFWPAWEVESPADGAREVMLADIDGDDDLDIAAALRDEDRIVWYAAGDDSEPVSWTRHDIGPASGPRGVYVADINGDGRLDVVAGSMNDGAVLWFEAPPDPSGIWSPCIVDTDLAGVKGVFACDIDGDNDLDIIAAGRDAGMVVWYEQRDLDPGWDRHVIDADIPGAVSVWCGDLIGDGRPEVAVTAKFAGCVALYTQADAPHTPWIKQVIDDDLLEACPISAGDFDGDGRTDLVAAGKAAGLVAWYRAPAEAGASWQRHVVDDAAGGCMGVTAGDVDGDGDWDIAATACMEGTVVWYENDQCDTYCGFTDGTGMCESDGVYKWHATLQEWRASWWCPRPYFLAANPHVPGQYFCGTHIGLYRSSDMVQWEEIGGGVLPDSVRCIWFSPDDPLDIMVGTERGLYRSAPFDPGWERVDGIPELPVNDIETGWHQYYPPFDPALFVSVGNGSFDDGVFCSHDMGAYWQRILTVPLPTDLLQDYTEQHHPLAMFVATRGRGIQRVDCSGVLLRDLNAGLPDLDVRCLRYDPFIDTPAIYAGTAGGLHLCMLLEPSTRPEAQPGLRAPPARLTSRAWPNPWRADVSFQLGAAVGGPATLRVFDTAGRQVWSDAAAAGGDAVFTWNGRDRRGRPLPPGLYFYRLAAGGRQSGGKVIRID